jgi:hypothetical protein
MLALIERRLKVLLEEAARRGVQKPFILTFITAENRVLVMRTPIDGGSVVLFQESGHERQDRNELPLYVVNELPVHIILSDKFISIHCTVGQDSIPHWVN